MTAVLPTKTRAGRPMNANPALQRDKIIRAALAEFAQKGFAGASLRTIAQEAGVAHGMIRHYFQSKELLFQSAADYLFGEMGKALLQAAEPGDDGDPVQQLARQIRAFVKVSAELPHLAGFLMQAGLDGGEQFTHLVETYVKPLQALSLAPYHQAVAQGLMRDMNPDFVFLVATHAAMAPFANTALRRALADASPHDPAQIEAYADTLIAMLTEGALTERYRSRQ